MIINAIFTTWYAGLLFWMYQLSKLVAGYQPLNDSVSEIFLFMIALNIAYIGAYRYFRHSLVDNDKIHLLQMLFRRIGILMLIAFFIMTAGIFLQDMILLSTGVV